ncbi:hypothetical protein TMatcc_005981 [Talaromyces marneffei ATCC 18224]|uniref:Uncharacterized protein n=1 Tax=Talaromyces marneffei (strain ATCC 18224 / CBS 334.59 / QM 7333) TaxID=441960 RepID=B6Q8I2_TALMQ|nr:uncharacterized protein EYB26_005526 [Talaromyces marneffei]EEA25786.1 hypothetical protein PMAA_068800 [Talaromyces marneffei ATCC 18224]KAE8554483.1 hypothetical protein EYB25_003022 [Talaromyces marneffei]QGA17850.1 hypothetical protein EYB26_005526 [Talaromyces marneffei]
MASAQESPKKRIVWTPELNKQLFVTLINCLEPSAINYFKVAANLGEGFSRDIVYKRIYDIKKKGVNMVEKSTPKKRKVVTDADENS